MARLEEWLSTIFASDTREAVTHTMSVGGKVWKSVREALSVNEDCVEVGMRPELSVSTPLG